MPPSCPERGSAEYARRLGFSPQSVFRGLYTIDQTRFGSVAAGSADRLANPSFLFCGRLVPEKAPDVLADAYRIYRKSVAQPWPLQVVGHGPFDGGLAGMPGVRMSDFVQPEVLAGVYADAGALILPSRFDCWGGGARGMRRCDSPRRDLRRVWRCGRAGDPGKRVHGARRGPGQPRGGTRRRYQRQASNSARSGGATAPR